MKKILLLLPLLLTLPSCENLTPEQKSKLIDRGLLVVDALTGAVVGKINPASGNVAVPPK